MSRVGKLPIPIPSGVTVVMSDGSVRVKGPKGSLELRCPRGVRVSEGDATVRVERESDSRLDRAAHGLARRLIANMVDGVTEGFTRTLEINGVGYRAEVRENAVHLLLGYSHPVVFELPAGVAARVERQTLVLTGIDRQALGQAAAGIRALRRAEPYKGKGIKYAEETVRRKAGKAAGAK